MMVPKLVYFLWIGVVSFAQEHNKIAFYCVSNLTDNAILVVENNTSKDTELKRSEFGCLGNEVKPVPVKFINSSTWHMRDYSTNYGDFYRPVWDQRWESLHDSHENTGYVTDLGNFSYNTYFSIVNGTVVNLFLFHASDRTLFECNEQYPLNCSMKLGVKSTEFSSQQEQKLWKLHQYSYLYSNVSVGSSTLYSNKTIPSNNCTNATQGCLLLYLAACKECQVSIELHSINHNLTHFVNGTGEWVTHNITLGNFSDCFSMNVTTSDTENNTFWAAIGTEGTLFLNQSCTHIKRFIKYDQENATCKDVFNNIINATTADFCPKLIEKTHENIETMDNDDDILKESFFNIILFTIITALIVIIILIALLIYFVKRKSHKGIEEASLELLHSEETAFLPDNYQPIKMSEFPNYVKQMFDPNNVKPYLEQQYSTIPTGELHPITEAHKESNVAKNRYPNILPYDHSRVILKKNLGESDSSDYINANYVKGVNSDKEYIVTQNPLENTVVDFYRMIWQENVAYVVMISITNEKFFRYWPKDRQDNKYYEGIEITLLKKTKFEFYNRHVLEVRRYGQTRKVHHLHFHAWSQDVLSPHIFIQFINNLLEIPHNNAPTVFHCLAGVGRSGTILLCDLVLRSATLTGSYNFYDLTNQLRQYRMNMVSNLNQYKLAHLIVYESTMFKDNSLDTDSEFEAQFSRMLEGNITKKIWSEYLENTEWLHKAITPYKLCTEFLKTRNRYTDLNKLPVDHSRVVLQLKKPDYIHAMYVNDYDQNKKFIVAQQPLRNTLDGFWIMVLQNHVQVVINLNEIDPTNKSEVRFYPTPEKPHLKVAENIAIQFCSEKQNLYFDELLVKIYSQERVVGECVILNVRGWPNIRATPETTDAMINLWEYTKKTANAHNFPLLVCCDDGIISSSLVVCFFYLAEKMLRLHKCDIVGAVRAVRRTNTNFITFEQFIFLHKCALDFYKGCYNRIRARQQDTL